MLPTGCVITLVTKQQVQEVLERMAVIVDNQNANDAFYQPMAADFANSIYEEALRTCYDLILKAPCNRVVILNHYCMQHV